MADNGTPIPEHIIARGEIPEHLGFSFLGRLWPVSDTTSQIHQAQLEEPEIESTGPMMALQHPKYITIRGKYIICLAFSYGS
jgi:hypothetical protein